jgi:hypothetical protein
MRMEKRTPRTRTFMSFSEEKKLLGLDVRAMRSERARCSSYLGSMTGLSYTLAELIEMVPELSGFKTTGPCEVSL